MKSSSRPASITNLLVIVASLLVVLLILEISVRTYNAFHGGDFFSDPNNRIKKGVRPVLPFRTFGKKLYEVKDGVRYIRSRHKELYPIEKPEGTYRVVVFGGSTSENKYAYRKAGIHFPGVLQSRLRESVGSDSIEVINVANSAYATPHSLILLQLDVISWNPDLVILSHNINDLTAAYFPEFTSDYSNKFSHGFYQPKFRKVYSLSNQLGQHSHLYWFIRARLDEIDQRNTPNIKRKSYGMETPPELIEVYQRNLRTFTLLAKANGSQVLLGSQALQPSEKWFHKHMRYKPYNDVVTYPLHEEFVAHHEQVNLAMKQVADEEGALFVDNNSALQGKKEYFRDFVHYTPEGINVLAENYLDAILRNNLIPQHMYAGGE